MIISTNLTRQESLVIIKIYCPIQMLQKWKKNELNWLVFLGNFSFYFFSMEIVSFQTYRSKK